MVIDASALIAILTGESEARVLIAAIETADRRRLSVATFAETSIVIESRMGAEGLRDLDRFIAVSGVEVAAVDREQGDLARFAYSRFGKGRHRAGLNYGDCFAYGLAKAVGEPLLCKGDDFVHTDLALVPI